MNTKHICARLLATATVFASLLCLAGPPAPRALAQQAAAPTKTREIYSCPMHPDVSSNAPGRCPKCKMNLTARAQAGADGAVRPSSATGATDVPAARGTKMSIPDVEVLDQDGRRLRFHTDLVKGRTVVINFIFTNCTTICPPLAATFARLQRELGDRAGRDVSLISVSVDPVTDTPERMKNFLTKFRAGPGWTFVTAEKSQMDTLLQALGAATSRPEDHTPSVLIGNDAAAQWTRAYGLARPSQLLELIDAAAAGRLDKPAQEARQP